MSITINRIESSGWFTILTAILMLSYWTLFAVLIPMKEEYINWILDSDWVWVNSIGFVGSLTGIFAINSIFSILKSARSIDLIAYLMAVSGIVILTSILFFETFILKSIALVNPEIIDLNTGMHQSIVFQSVSIIGGILLSIGVIMLGIRLIIKKTFIRWKIVLFIIACPLFGIVYMPGNIRLLGIVLYTISLTAIGIEMNNKYYPWKFWDS